MIKDTFSPTLVRIHGIDLGSADIARLDDEVLLTTRPNVSSLPLPPAVPAPPASSRGILRGWQVQQPALPRRALSFRSFSYFGIHLFAFKQVLRFAVALRHQLREYMLLPSLHRVYLHKYDSTSAYKHLVVRDRY